MGRRSSNFGKVCWESHYSWYDSCCFLELKHAVQATFRAFQVLKHSALSEWNSHVFYPKCCLNFTSEIGNNCNWDSASVPQQVPRSTLLSRFSVNSFVQERVRNVSAMSMSALRSKAHPYSPATANCCIIIPRHDRTQTARRCTPKPMIVTIPKDSLGCILWFHSGLSTAAEVAGRCAQAPWE